MSGVLVSAGERDTLLSRAGLLGYIGVLVACFTAIHYLAVDLGADPVAVQLGEWVLWLTWLAIVFPASRTRTVGATPRSAYRTDLIRQIVPGFAAITAINFAPIAEQLIRGAEDGYWESPLVDAPLALGLAAVLLALGGALVLIAVRAIGLPAAAFLEEYQPQPPPQRPVGPYRWIRHPIAVGGMCVMTATTLAFGVGGGVWLVNILMLAAYGPLEDLRLKKVFGHRSEYSRTVPRFIPRLVPARAGR
ncbi:MAG TPA: methyltransferase [Solirubrobacterales bacterium]|nr:methyltransferase [Solirubrobacterales bacterium]